MTYTAIKKYLHSTTITPKEVHLIKDLMVESGQPLKEFLPTEKNLRTYFLVDLLSNALKNCNDHEGFIREILSLKNKDNEETFYMYLRQHKNGLQLIKDNPDEYQADINVILADVLQQGSAKDVLNFIKEHKDRINIEVIYKFRGLSLKLIQSLEKEGFCFDERIIDVVNNKASYSSPHKLLQYMQKFEASMSETRWNLAIINMLSFFDREHWDWNGKYKFKDSIFLMTKIKNPGQYKWGQSLSNNRIDGASLSFINCLQAYLQQDSSDDKYINPSNKDNFKELRNFIGSHDIHFQTLRGQCLLFLTFIDNLSERVIADAIKTSWSDMFAFEGRKKAPFFNKDSLIVGFLHETSPLLTHERTRPVILKEYFSQTNYRLDKYDEVTLFNQLGINKKSIKEEKVLAKYYEVLSLSDIRYITEKIGMESAQAEKEFLEYGLHKSEEKTFKKPKI